MKIFIIIFYRSEYLHLKKSLIQFKSTLWNIVGVELKGARMVWGLCKIIPQNILIHLCLKWATTGYNVKLIMEDRPIYYGK